MEQAKFLRLTQGEVLRILVIRDGRSADEIAKAMGYNSYTYLSRLYLKTELNMSQIETASQVLGVHPDVFNPRSIDELAEIVSLNKIMINELKAEQHFMSAKIERLEEEKRNMAFRLEECENKRRILERANN